MKNANIKYVIMQYEIGAKYSTPKSRKSMIYEVMMVSGLKMAMILCASMSGRKCRNPSNIHWKVL